MGIFITVFVLAMEFIGPKFRTICGVAIQIPFALGELYIVLIAYLVRSWRIYQAVLAAPFFLFLFYLFFIPESVRWLISRLEFLEMKLALLLTHSVTLFFKMTSKLIKIWHFILSTLDLHIVDVI